MSVSSRQTSRFGFALFLFSCLLWFGGLLLGGLLLTSPAHAQSVPQAVGVASGTGGVNWILWNNPDGTATVWKVNGDAAGTVAANYTYGPYSGWTARSIAAGSDGVPRILWTNTSGQVSLWNLADANPSATCHLYGPYSGYTATALAISPSNTTPRILWNKSDGSITLWNVDAAGDQPGNGTSTQFVFSAFTGYTAMALTVVEDNLPRILWTKPGGNISLWKVDTSGGYTHVEFGPFAGYTSVALAAGPDSNPRIVWNYSDGTLSLWKFDASGNPTAQNYGPYTNWAVKAISVSSDNVAHPLWANTNGSGALWNIAANGSSTQNTYPEPASVSLSPNSIGSGSTSTGTVTLNCPSPYGGTVVSLSSSNTAAATVPSSVTVPAGQTSATFTVTGQSISSATTVTITANYWVNQSAALTVNPPASSAPTGLVASVSGGRVLLSWSAPSGQVTSYKLLRGTSSGAESSTPVATMSGSPPAASYTDASVVSGQKYYYKVVASNGGGDSPASAEAFVTLLPGVPTGFIASSGNTQATLVWTAPAGTVTSYNVKRGTASGGPYTTISTAGAVTSTSYTDTNLTNGTAYYYVVSAVAAVGEGANSSEASATPAVPPAPPSSLTASPGTGNVTLSWIDSDGAVAYNLYRSTTSGSGYVLVLQNLTSTAATDPGLTNGTTYFYVVTALGSTGSESVPSDEAMAMPYSSPAAPTVTAAYGYSAGGLRSWKTVGGQTTYFLYDGSTPLCELDGNGNVLATNTWGNTGLISRRVGSSSTFYAFDPSGNVAQRLSSSGGVLGSYLFDAFGLRTGTDTDLDPYSGFGGQWGGYTDSESGLTLFAHRYYDSGTGRFLTRDPLGYAGGSNLYAYAANNPVMLADPSGFCPTTDRDIHPGMYAGTEQSQMAGAMTQNLQNTVVMAAAGAALTIIGATFQGASVAEETAEGTTAEGTTAEGEGSAGNGILSLPDRLKKFFDDLGNKPPAKSPSEGLEQVTDSMNSVEDTYSGIPYEPVPGKLDPSNGRMYPPFDDSIVTNPDGSLTGTTRKNVINVDKDGTISILRKKHPDPIFHKPGGG